MFLRTFRLTWYCSHEHSVQHGRTNVPAWNVGSAFLMFHAMARQASMVQFTVSSVQEL